MNQTTPQTADFPHPRQLGAVNWLGLWVLTRKETERFLKVYAQALLAPVITTLLFYAVFSLALGGGQRMVGDVPYMTFLAPGLVMMSMAQNAFANTSSSLVISKVQGNIVDVLMPPLSGLELTCGYIFGGIARGVVIGVVSIAALALFTGVDIQHPGFVILHALLGSMLLAQLGLIGGIWSDKFDHLAAVQNFIVMPATFLSGTFYTTEKLSVFWRFLCHVDPFFYMIDGFRYGFIGQSDGTLMFGLFYLIAVNAALFAVAYKLIATGYKLKS
ncbi:MAG: ABC transporter permease [Alphaproteobacteria bacterium]|nr:ABC transporter permease [Alphaproteobacteria bacterium]MBV8548887.1 ABC transporter permease [Alphaproteobacteria bacterium]